MKAKNFILFFILIAALIIGFAFRGQSKEKKIGQHSPLALPNKIIPELMGAVKTKKSYNTTPEELVRTQEIQRFRNYLETSYVRLPSIETVRLSKEGDFHRVPFEVIESSEIFGEIADKLKSNSTLTKEALKFYSACAINEQLITSIRAVCARNLIDWSKKARIDISRISIPDNIIRIAEVLPIKN